MNAIFPGLRAVPVAAIAAFALASAWAAPGAGSAVSGPETVLWADRPADQWKCAFPLGNGRLGALVFGRIDEERIALNEDTYWTGGPYTTVVPGSAQALPEIRRLIFEGDLRKAHTLFGRGLMGYPVEQMKYQALADLVLAFPDAGPASAYRHDLDLDTAIDTTSYERGGIRRTREVFASPVDQVVAIRIEASKPGTVAFTAQLRGRRNEAHSNYATDYFRMDGFGSDGLVLRGKSADYMGVPGALRYEARLKVLPEGGSLEIEGDRLRVAGADAVTLLVAAATNFRSYKEVGGDPGTPVEAALRAASAKSYRELKDAHVREHRRLFRRASLELGNGPGSARPTVERLKDFDGSNDPSLAALLFRFGRYILIASSRPGTQPANLQGIWNVDMNPAWDSKYTTNINTEMNYWPAEAANLSECAEPLFRMIEELTDQGSRVAREHYGARGWVFHQNTDLWRVAAPMDGPSWGAFATGGAWLATHLWEHYLFTGDTAFLKRCYPVLKGSAEFFLDFLVHHPRYGWLVTNPSTSPENFPAVPGIEPFFDEITGFMTTPSIAAGSTIDMRILHALFEAVGKAAGILGTDSDLAARVREASARLAPMRIGRKGNLQEWLEDWGETEKSHRHISGLWGLFPGREISPRRTPDLAAASRIVLEQRGLEGNGWSSAWKAACWARLGNGTEALANAAFAARNYTTGSLLSICSGAPQVDGSLGMTAAFAEMILQSQEDEIALLPALPPQWKDGEARGLRARGGFEVGIRWDARGAVEATILSLNGNPCRVRASRKLDVYSGSREIQCRRPEPGVLEFATTPGTIYEMRPPAGDLRGTEGDGHGR